MATEKEKPSLLAKLREPFPPNQISKLPKESKAQAEARKADKNLIVWKCEVCGGAHHKNAVHLDYVGHAALTDRLLDTDIEWSWEPLSYGPDGLPLFDARMGLWIKLTVQGVSRLGYGAADGKTGGDAIKEIIGDALRNAAMRFGAALDLWHKGDLHLAEPDEAKEVEQPKKVSEAQLAGLRAIILNGGINEEAFCEHVKVKSVADILAADFQKAKALLEKAAAARKPKEESKVPAEITGDDIPY